MSAWATIAIALVVFFLYGGMSLGFLPQEAGISFEYHGGGLLAGIAMSDTDKRPARLSARGGVGAVMGVKKLKAIVIDLDLRRAFVEGMGYVALSRVRSLATLSLAGFNRMALTVSEDARAVDLELRTCSMNAVDQFAVLQDTPEAVVPKGA